MNRRTCSALLLLLFTGGLPPALGGKAADRPRVDPKADEVLKKSCACLAALEQFGFKVEETFDEMSASGQKIQLSNHRTVRVKRPNRLRVESEGDTAKRHFFSTGRQIANFHPNSAVLTL